MKLPNRTMTLAGRKSFYGYLFIMPWIVGFLLFFLWPMILSVIFAFNKVSAAPGGYTMRFLGFQNFNTALLVDAQYPQDLASSIGSLFMHVPVILVFSFFVAWLLKQKFTGVNLVKAMFFFPVIMSSGLFTQLQTGSVTSNLDATMQNASNVITVLKSVNLSNYLLEVGIPSSWVSLLTAPVNQIYSIITNSGIQIFIFLAGLNAISPSLYEACYIEGATEWETFWKITFPMMTPLILVNAIYSIIDTFTSSSNTVMQYVYNLAFGKYNFGLSSAMSLVYLLILGSIMAVVALLISRKTFYQA